YLVGDSTMSEIMSRMTYPDPAMEEVTDGSHTRHVFTSDFIHLAEEISGMDLGWFFEAYLRRAALPRLAVIRHGVDLEFRWDAPIEEPFSMPIEVQIGDEVQRVEMPEGRALIQVPEGEDAVFDPGDWVLRAGR